MTTLQIKQLLGVSALAGLLIAVGGQSAHAESLQSPASTATTAPTAVINAETVVRPSSAATRADSLQAAPDTTPAATQTTPSQAASTTTNSANSAGTTLAQGVDVGRPTRSGSSYIGIGGNIGFGGDTGLGTGNFAVISKVGLTRNLSLRPSALVGDGVTFLLPATVDFPIAVSADVDGERIGLAPYIGGGVTIDTDDDGEVQPLVTAGIDVPISRDFTANASANVSFPDDAEVGVILGIGYNFR